MTPSLSVGNAGNDWNACTPQSVTPLPRYPLTNGRIVTGVTGVTDPARWPIVVALLHSPVRESRRLAALLEQLPTERRRHEIPDDCMRRPGAGRRSLEGTDRTPGALPSFVKSVVLE